MMKPPKMGFGSGKPSWFLRYVRGSCKVTESALKPRTHFVGLGNIVLGKFYYNLAIITHNAC